MKDNITRDKCMDFSIRIVNLYKYLVEKKKEKIISGQLIRSGTAIGSNLSESDYAVSKNDFINKNHIAIKEANETLYWLELLFKTEYLNEKEYVSIKDQCVEIIKIISAILKTSKSSK